MISAIRDIVRGENSKFIQQGNNLLWGFLHVRFKGIGSMVARKKMLH